MGMCTCVYRCALATGLEHFERYIMRSGGGRLYLRAPPESIAAGIVHYCERSYGGGAAEAADVKRRNRRLEAEEAEEAEAEAAAVVNAEEAATNAEAEATSSSQLWLACAAGGILCVWLFYLEELALTPRFLRPFCAVFAGLRADVAAHRQSAELCEALLLPPPSGGAAAGGDLLLRLPLWVF